MFFASSRRASVDGVLHLRADFAQRGHVIFRVAFGEQRMPNCHGLHQPRRLRRSFVPAEMCNRGKVPRGPLR